MIEESKASREKSFNDDVRTSMQSSDINKDNASFSQHLNMNMNTNTTHSESRNDSQIKYKSNSKQDKVITEISQATSAFNTTDKKQFSFHPGTFDFGKKGFWSDGWKCCGRAWNDEGCKKTKIDPNSALKLLICYN